MKHVFLINNHISYLMARKIIEHHGIPKSDVLLLSVRQYVFPDDSDLTEIERIPYEFFSSFHFTSRRWTLSSFFHRKERILKPIHNADSEIEHKIGDEDFALYTYHICSYNSEILFSMPHCIEVNYVEEGALAYAVTQQNDSVKQSLKRCFDLFVKRWLTQGRYGHDLRANHFDLTLSKFHNIYCCCEESFRGYPHKVVLGFPFQKLDKIPDDISAVIVFDGGIVSFDQQLESNEIAVTHFAKNHPHGVLHYKFHPSQKGEICSQYRAHFIEMEKKYNVTIRELPEETVLERLIASLKDQLDIYIICSSVGLYGFMGKSRVFTTAKHFIRDVPHLQAHYDTYGYIFSRYQEL